MNYFSSHLLTSHGRIAVEQTICLPAKLHIDGEREQAKQSSEDEQNEHLGRGGGSDTTDERTQDIVYKFGVPTCESRL